MPFPLLLRPRIACYFEIQEVGMSANAIGQSQHWGSGFGHRSGSQAQLIGNNSDALTGISGIMSIRIKDRLYYQVCFHIVQFLDLRDYLGIIGVTLHLCSIRSFGVPFMMSFTSLRPRNVRDTFIRAPLKFLNKRQEFVVGENKYKMGKAGK